MLLVVVITSFFMEIDFLPPPRPTVGLVLWKQGGAHRWRVFVVRSRFILENIRGAKEWARLTLYINRNHTQEHVPETHSITQE